MTSQPSQNRGLDGHQTLLRVLSVPLDSSPSPSASSMIGSFSMVFSHSISGPLRRIWMCTAIHERNKRPYTRTIQCLSRRKLINPRSTDRQRASHVSRPRSPCHRLVFVLLRSNISSFWWPKGTFALVKIQLDEWELNYPQVFEWRSGLMRLSPQSNVWCGE